MLIDEDRTWERKRQLEMETAIEDAVKENTKKVRKEVKQEVMEKTTRSFIESLIRDGSMAEAKIARITKVSVDFVQRLKEGLTLA